MVIPENIQPNEKWFYDILEYCVKNPNLLEEVEKGLQYALYEHNRKRILIELEELKQLK